MNPNPALNPNPTLAPAPRVRPTGLSFRWDKLYLQAGRSNAAQIREVKPERGWAGCKPGPPSDTVIRHGHKCESERLFGIGAVC